MGDKFSQSKNTKKDEQGNSNEDEQSDPDDGTESKIQQDQTEVQESEEASGDANTDGESDFDYELDQLIDKFTLLLEPSIDLKDEELTNLLDHLFHNLENESNNGNFLRASRNVEGDERKVNCLSNAINNSQLNETNIANNPERGYGLNTNNPKMIPTFGLTDVRNALKRAETWGDVMVKVGANFPSSIPEFLALIKEELIVIGKSSMKRKECGSIATTVDEMDIYISGDFMHMLVDYQNEVRLAIIEFIKSNKALYEELSLEVEAMHTLKDNCNIQ